MLVILMMPALSFSQDKRTLETKIADMVAQMPANDQEQLTKLMEEMQELGEEGRRKICDQIIPAGTGDDTKYRFAAESYSRYLSQKDKESDRSSWEQMCISFVSAKADAGVKDFFMKQLQLIGSDAAAEAMKILITDKSNCSPAISVLAAVGGEAAENILAESLRDMSLPCAAAVMNALASMKSQKAVAEYIAWTVDADLSTVAAAYNALARSASPQAYKVLLKAARSYDFRWETTGATASLLNYARACMETGNLRTAEKISSMLIRKCNDRSSVQNRIAALQLLTDLKGSSAIDELVRAGTDSDSRYRNAALRISETIQDPAVLRAWIDYLPAAEPFARPDIISFLGRMRDKSALPVVIEAFGDDIPQVRQAAAGALASISGADAAPYVISYMAGQEDPSDQQAAVQAFMNIAGVKEAALLADLLNDGHNAAKQSAIELMAWKKQQEYFARVFPYTGHAAENVKNAAFAALASLAGPEDQDDLISLLRSTVNSKHIADIQAALASAAGKIAEPGKRSSVMIKMLGDQQLKEKLIPILPKTGGTEALDAVLHEFKAGDPSVKAVAFKALSEWKDFNASSALYEICASGDERYKEAAFKGYVQQVKTASVPDDQKLLLYRKIMPFADNAVMKNAILAELGNLKTYPALFFLSEYLDDPDVSAVAAKSAMFTGLPSSDGKNGMYGHNVREILTKAAARLSGPESEYNREMIHKYLQVMPDDEGFVSIFNGVDLTGWQGLVENPVARAKMKPSELARKQAEADKKVPLTWSVRSGAIWFNGKGNNLCSIKEYGDFEMLVDWKITKKGDSGIYLRGTPQVQIWDTSRVEVGAQVGSGGLYNNQKNTSIPLLVADNPVGDWNSFRILMTGEKVSVWLNGHLVVDDVVMENYWDRSIPIFPKGPVELQAHGTDLAFRDIYIREIDETLYNLTGEEKAEGFISLFNGRNLDNWTGNKESYVVEDGMIVIKPEKGSGGNLYTENEYSDFILRFEFMLTPDANNGLGIRAPLTGDAAYTGMELQILDNTAPVYAKLQPYQYHGSVYGVIPAKRGYLKPVGEWNYQQVEAVGTRIKVTLNGTVIVDGDIAGPRDNGTMDGREHPGLKNKAGHIGFLGHGSVVRFRNIRIKDVSR